MEYACYGLTCEGSIPDLDFKYADLKVETLQNKNKHSTLPKREKEWKFWTKEKWRVGAFICSPSSPVPTLLSRSPFFIRKKKKIYNIFCQKIWLNIFSGIFSLNIFYSQDLNSTYLKRIILDHLDLLFSLNDSTLVLKITSSFLLHYIGL